MDHPNFNTETSPGFPHLSPLTQARIRSQKMPSPLPPGTEYDPPPPGSHPLPPIVPSARRTLLHHTAPALRAPTAHNYSLRQSMINISSFSAITSAGRTGPCVRLSRTVNIYIYFATRPPGHCYSYTRFAVFITPWPVCLAAPGWWRASLRCQTLPHWQASGVRYPSLCLFVTHHHLPRLSAFSDPSGDEDDLDDLSLWSYSLKSLSSRLVSPLIIKVRACWRGCPHIVTRCPLSSLLW